MSAKTIMTYNNRTIIIDELIVRTTNATACTYASLKTIKKAIMPV